VARANDAEAVADSFESVAKSIEGAAELRGTRAPPEVVKRVTRIARRQIKRIEDGCEDWLASDLGANWQKNPDGDAMLAALEDVLPACLPGPDGFATKDIVSSRIVDAALIRAAALDPKDLTFAKGGIGHNVLRSLLVGSISALEDDAEFRELLQLSGLRELLRRSREHDEAAERRHLEVLEAIACEKGVDPKVLTPLFDHLGHRALTLDEMRSRDREAIEAMLSRARQKVEPSNKGADIDATIGAARARLENLDTAGARSILATKIAEEETARRHRLVPLLGEQAAIELLSYDYDAAKATLRKLLALDPEHVWYCVELGDLLVITAALDQAADVFQHSLAIAKRLAQADSGNAGWQRALAVAHGKIGEVQVAQGNLLAALTNGQAAHDIVKRLAEADPSNAGWQRDLAHRLGVSPATLYRYIPAARTANTPGVWRTAKFFLRSSRA
jgi:predicted Zn-dependent protease